MKRSRMHIRRRTSERRDDNKRRGARSVKIANLREVTIPSVLGLLNGAPGETNLPALREVKQPVRYRHSSAGLVNWDLIDAVSRDPSAIERSREALNGQANACATLGLFISKLPPGVASEIQTYPATTVLSLSALYSRPTVLLDILRRGKTAAGVAALWREHKSQHPPLRDHVGFIPNRIGGYGAELLLGIIRVVAWWYQYGAYTIVDPQPPASARESKWKGTRLRHRWARRHVMFLAIQYNVDLSDIASSLGCTEADAIEGYKQVLDDPAICATAARISNALHRRGIVTDDSVSKLCGSFARDAKGRRDSSLLRKAMERKEAARDREIERERHYRKHRGQRASAEVRNKWGEEMDRGDWRTSSPSPEDHIIQRVDAQRHIDGLDDQERAATLRFMLGDTKPDVYFDSALHAVEVLLRDDLPPKRSTVEVFGERGAHKHRYRKTRFENVFRKWTEWLCRCGKERPEKMELPKSGLLVDAQNFIPQRHRSKLLLLDVQRHRCGLCGKRMSFKGATWDHIKPLDLGGAVGDIENLHLVCKRCNRKKGNRDAQRRVQ